MKRGPAGVLIGLALLAATATPVAGEEKIHITFTVAHVEDRYALNFPIIRDIFRLLDFGYAGCSVELAVTSKGIEIPPDANVKIQVDYIVELGPGKAPYASETKGSITRRSVPLYLNNKCAEISKIEISHVACFDGFKGQWSKLPCPYDFQNAHFSIQQYYRRGE